MEKGDRGQSGGRGLPDCLHRDQEPGKLLWGMLCALAHVLVGKAVDWVWGDLGSSCDPAACAV